MAIAIAAHGLGHRLPHGLQGGLLPDEDHVVVRFEDQLDLRRVVERPLGEIPLAQ